MKPLWLDRELVRNPFYVGLCKSEDAFHTALRRMGVPRDKWGDFLTSASANATAHYFENAGKRVALVCMGSRRGRKRVEVDGLLIHEAVHLWQWIKEDIGESEPSKEFEAYSIQHLAQDLIHAYWS